MASSLSMAASSVLLPGGLHDFQEKKARILQQFACSERLAEVRQASQLEVRPRPEMLSSGIPQLDALAGGLPRGCLTQLFGSASSGKTSVLVAALTSATRQSEICVLIDASDSFDPSSAAKAGVEFDKLLWVRCGDSGTRSAELQSSPQTQRASSQRRLEQVLKTTDLILQSGGFGLVALDLAGIPQKFVRRIPLASWFRFQHAVEDTKTALLVVSEFPCAESCAALALRLENHPSAISHELSEKPAHAQILSGMHVQAEVVRSRFDRKPSQSVKTAFATQAVRAG